MIRLCAFADEASADLDRQISALKRNDIFLTEFRSAYGKNVGSLTLAEASEYCERMGEAGISVWSVGSPLGKTDITTSREEYFESVHKLCEIAGALKSEKIRCFSFFKAYEAADEVIYRLNEAVKIADSYNVMLCHENEKEVFGDTAERVQLLMDSVKGLKFVYDPANFIQMAEPAEKTLDAFHKRCEYFHIKDVIAATDELVPAGYGDGNIAGLIDRITDDRVLTLEPHLMVFEGYAAIDNTEMKNKFEFKDSDKSFDFAANSLKKLLANAGYKYDNHGGYVK